MPKVTLYVKDVDEPTWKRARALTGDIEESLSSVVSDLLKSYVDRQQSQKTAEERTGKSMQELEFELSGPLNNNVRRVAKFTGANLASGTGYQIGGDQAMYTLFITIGGSLVVHAASGRGSTVRVFRKFDEFQSAVEYEEDGEMSVSAPHNASDSGSSKKSRTISRSRRTDGSALALGRIGEAGPDVAARQLRKIRQDLGLPHPRRKVAQDVAN